MSGPEPKPCPFCGGENLEEDTIGRVSCTGCGATAPYGYHTTETWNTRAPDIGALDADALAQIIRRVDGENRLGAGTLAEAIIAALADQKGGAA